MVKQSHWCYYRSSTECVVDHAIYCVLGKCPWRSLTYISSCIDIISSFAGLACSLYTVSLIQGNVIMALMKKD